MTATLTFDAVSVLRNRLPVTHEVSLQVMPGRITALIGPNGAGKSSLVLTASGSLSADGSVRLDDVELIGKSADQVRRLGVAAIPEGHHVLGGLSVLDNLKAAATSFPRREIDGRLELVFDALPELHELVDRRGGDLSGGQQQMLAIGQGLVCQPKVMIVDELSLGLAPIVVDRLLKLIQELAAQGTAILLIEQFTAKALAVANDAHVISGGQLIYSGDVQPLVDDPEIIRSAYLGRLTA